jgi:KDO2-lipid IV(A) lauroyltransferase
MTVELRQRAEYAAVVATAFIVRALPAPVARGLGRVVGTAFFTIDRRRRTLALENLAAAFPQWARHDCVRTGRRVFRHFGCLLVELLRFRGARDELGARIEFEGLERALHAQRLGRGALFITGHFGFWELHAIAHGAFVNPIAVVARPLDNPLLHEMLEQVRTATGNTVIYRRGGMRRILRTLAANGGVAVLIDQHIQPAESITVDFFGRPAATTGAVAALAARTRAPVIPVFALPAPGGRFRLIYEAPVAPPASDSPEDLQAFTQRCTDVLEMYVRRYPDLWLWMHRRWRPQTTGDPKDAPTATRELESG